MPHTIPPILIALAILCLIAATRIALGHIVNQVIDDERAWRDEAEAQLAGDPYIAAAILKEMAQAGRPPEDGEATGGNTKALLTLCSHGEGV